jgi:transglutaminase-like putative cysteine protease
VHVRRIVSALLAACLCGSASASDEAWFSVHLDGRKIGHMHSLRTVGADARVVSEQSLSLTVQRQGEVLTISTRERTWESVDGAALAFESRVDTDGSSARVYGDIRDGERIELQTEQHGVTQKQVLPWPKGALLTEGQRLAALRAGLAPGTHYRLLGYDPGSLQAITLETRVGALENVDIHGRTEQLSVVDQRMSLGDTLTQTRSWVDPATQALRRMRLPAIGLVLEMLACDRRCALAPVQPTDILASTVIAAPKPLSTRELRHPLRYELRLRAVAGDALARVPGQRFGAALDGAAPWLVVDPRGDARQPPQAEDLSSNRWLQADASEVITLARQAARGARGEAAQVAQLERFVRGYISTKSLRVGYASAREIIVGREGDCTEHAVLLAALTRALGIPARVATGVAYAQRFAGREHVFVPHAWVMAWVDGEWRGFDAALPRFDAGHIAFAVGDGDPFRFYGGIELLGSVDIVTVERIGRRELARSAQ